ncbi:hypothetical protein PINS_up016037 [Pythium insidiosum]|nr:hypothetical protein PINS_up016037 [Pythium insidiosum]
MDIGAHCSMAECRQQDFLPFTCDCCERVFCLEHRTYDGHACPNAGSRDRRVVQCPLCKQMLHWTPEQDVNLIWEQHVRGGSCSPDPSKLKTSVDANGELKTQPKKKKPRCGAERCRELLLASNQFHCPKCGLDVCLRHRFETDHDCEGVRQRRRQQRTASNGLSRGSSSAAATARSSSLSGAQAAMAIDTTKLQANARAAASSVMNGTRSAVNSFVEKSKAAITTNSEQCPICSQRFPYVSQLIAHVNRAHPDVDTRDRPSRQAASAAPSSGAGNEVCPQSDPSGNGF